MRTNFLVLITAASVFLLAGVPDGRAADDSQLLDGFVGSWKAAPQQAGESRRMAPPTQIDIVRCRENLCGFRVDADGKCSVTVFRGVNLHDGILGTFVDTEYSNENKTATLRMLKMDQPKMIRLFLARFTESSGGVITRTPLFEGAYTRVGEPLCATS